jgi:hypothetical protein
MNDDATRTEMLAVDPTSGGGGCPSIHWRAADRMTVIQAPEVDDATFSGLPNVLPGERGVYIKPEVILAAADEIRRRGLT